MYAVCNLYLMTEGGCGFDVLLFHHQTLTSTLDGCVGLNCPFIVCFCSPFSCVCTCISLLGRLNNILCTVLFFFSSTP